MNVGLIAVAGVCLISISLLSRQPRALSDVPCLPCDGGVRLRWPVKTLTDTDWREVQLAPAHETTVSQLLKLPQPSRGEMFSDAAKSHRISPVERQVFTVTAPLRNIGPAIDRDVHLSLAGAEGTTDYMFAEVIDPDCYKQCASKSAENQAKVAALYGRFVATRRTLTSAAFFRPTFEAHTVDGVTVTVTGVGFFDPGYSNHIELHPVLDLIIHK